MSVILIDFSNCLENLLETPSSTNTTHIPRPSKLHLYIWVSLADGAYDVDVQHLIGAVYIEF